MRRDIVNARVVCALVVASGNSSSINTLNATKIVLGSMDARKDKLDTIVRTSLVIKF